MKQIAIRLIAIVSASILTLATHAHDAKQHPSRALAGNVEGKGVLSDGQDTKEPFVPCTP